jgi:hypothetical protein
MGSTRRSSPKLSKTRMAKSVLGAGWGMLKTQLQYKGRQAGRCVSIVGDQYTSRACSPCGVLTGPAGVNGLRVRLGVVRVVTRTIAARMRREASQPRGGVPRPFSGTSPCIRLRRRAGHFARGRLRQRRLVRGHEHRLTENRYEHEPEHPFLLIPVDWPDCDSRRRHRDTGSRGTRDITPRNWRLSD